MGALACDQNAATHTLSLNSLVSPSLGKPHLSKSLHIVYRSYTRRGASGRRLALAAHPHGVHLLVDGIGRMVR